MVPIGDLLAGELAIDGAFPGADPSRNLDGSQPGLMRDLYLRKLIVTLSLSSRRNWLARLGGPRGAFVLARSARLSDLRTAPTE